MPMKPRRIGKPSDRTDPFNFQFADVKRRLTRVENRLDRLISAVADHRDHLRKTQSDILDIVTRLDWKDWEEDNPEELEKE